MLAFFIELSKDFLIFDSSLRRSQLLLLFSDLCNVVQQFVNTTFYSTISYLFISNIVFVHLSK